MSAAIAPPIPVLTTARLILRGPGMDDWPAWCAFATSERAQFVGGPYSEGGAWRAFAHVAGMWTLRGFGSFVFQLRGEDRPLGMAGPWYPADWPERELGWTVWDARDEGRGLAFEAAAAARDYAWSALGWTTAVSYIDHGNARSVALARRLGAREDPAAETPGGKPCHVYRHTPPTVAA